MPPLINHLFSYFDQEVNYILTGYVCKVLSSLFAKKGIQVKFIVKIDDGISFYLK